MRFDDFRQMRRNNRRRIDDGIAVPFGFRPLFFRQPNRVHTESGIFRFFSLQLFGYRTGIHAHIVTESDRAPPRFDAADFKTVFVRIERHVVDDADRRNDKSHIESGFVPYARNPFEKFRAFFFVDERDERIAEFERQGIERCYRRRIRGARAARLFFCRSGGSLRFFAHLRSCNTVSHKKEKSSEQNQKHRRSRTVSDKRNPHKRESRSDDFVDVPVDRKVFRKLFIESFVGAASRNDETGRKRKHERRDLRHKTVADRKLCIG